jgi:hypothetical protein
MNDDVIDPAFRFVEIRQRRFSPDRPTQSVQIRQKIAKTNGLIIIQ